MSKTIADAARERYHLLKAQGRCPRCKAKLGKKEAAGHTYCVDCRAYLAERAMERANGNLLREIAQAGEGGTVAETKAAQRARARAAGLCGICTTGKPDKGYKTCSSCRERSAAAYEAKKNRR